MLERGIFKKKKKKIQAHPSLVYPCVKFVLVGAGKTGPKKTLITILHLTTGDLLILYA